MKKVLFYAVMIFVAVIFANVCYENYSLRKRLSSIYSKEWINNSKNTIFAVDTIYGRKYVVAVDTITGHAEIIGLRHSAVMIEDSVE